VPPAAYSFLDPENGIKTLLLSLGGITLAQIVFFVLTWGIIKLRSRLTRRKQREVDSELREGILYRGETQH
jgi:hypothetical protein